MRAITVNIVIDSAGSRARAGGPWPTLRVSNLKLLGPSFLERVSAAVVARHLICIYKYNKQLHPKAVDAFDSADSNLTLKIHFSHFDGLLQPRNNENKDKRTHGYTINNKERSCDYKRILGKGADKSIKCSAFGSGRDINNR
ncbi:hypothetical protein HELRODRAFT_162307 [Helobdella robusta]|uniref:Uncharacterized protein n=1 Tax=Helobdella robusta TaxID=6412 RepID=T1ESH6_HELRO|nr:hypothetical protein HELRODRAFT_162307 [Helobdella robusta]ESN98847.1 hypothetical protein HELRODRAFT_162307 [Helobdella robusta]